MSRHAFALSILVAGLVSSPRAMEAADSVADAKACPYTAAELRAALGIDVAEGRPTETPYPGGKMMDCDYKGKKLLSITVAQVQAASPGDAAQIAKGVQGTAIPGDKDAAVWVRASGSVYRLGLSYVRNRTHTEVNVKGLNSKDDAAVAPMKSKLLKLRRVP